MCHPKRYRYSCECIGEWIGIEECEYSKDIQRARNERRPESDYMFTILAHLCHFTNDPVYEELEELCQKCYDAAVEAYERELAEKAEKEQG